MENKLENFTVEIDDDTLDFFKMMSVTHGIPLEELIARYLKQHAEEHKKIEVY